MDIRNKIFSIYNFDIKQSSNVSLFGCKNYLGPIKQNGDWKVSLFVYLYSNRDTLQSHFLGTVTYLYFQCAVTYLFLYICVL